MTFSDFTKTRQLDSVKSLQLEKGKWKLEEKNKFWPHVGYTSETAGQKELMSSVIHHQRSPSRGY